METGGTSAHMMGTPAGAGEALERGNCEELGKKASPTDVSAFSCPYSGSVCNPNLLSGHPALMIGPRSVPPADLKRT